MSDELVNNPYNLLKEQPKKYISFILLIVVFLVILLFNQKVFTTMNIQGVVKNQDGYKVFLYVPYQNVINISQGKLLIENKIYNYKLINVSDDLNQINNQNIQEVVIEVNLLPKYQVNNLIIEIKIIKSEEKVYQKLWNNLKERE